VPAISVRRSTSVIHASLSGPADAPRLSGIRNPRVAAEDTERVTVKIEGKGRSVPVAVWRRRTVTIMRCLLTRGLLLSGRLRRTRAPARDNLASSGLSAVGKGCDPFFAA
jgi:hypothetical protein